MRLWELIEGADGKLDEQSMLSIMLCLTLIGLTVFAVVVRHAEFRPLDFAYTCGAFMGSSLTSLTVRSRFSKSGAPDAQPAVQ